MRRPRAVVVDIDAGEAGIEPLGGWASALARARRSLGAFGRSALNFEGVEIFPEGSKRRTRDYRKLVKSARDARAPFDGEVLRARPELILGWDAEPAARNAPALATTASIAVVLHLHYVELWPEIATLLGRCGAPFTLFLSLTKPNAVLAARAREEFSDCDVRVVANSGRDVRPFLALLEEGALDAFDLVCKIHGKRSLRPGYPPLLGDMIRRLTLTDLLGSAAQVELILNLFASDGRLGIVGPERFRASSRHGKPEEIMGASRASIEAMAVEMGGAIAGADYDVFAGTMFWARPRALEPLRRLSLAAHGFAPEAGVSDGALEHAVEGLFNHSARLAGFSVAGVSAER